MSSSKIEQSFGIAPLKKEKEQWMMLLVHHAKGHWALPKGHSHLNETAQQTAERELLEETGLEVVRYLSSHLFEEKYQFENEGKTVFKTVHYFLAEVQGTLQLQLDEVISAKWFPLEEAATAATFDEHRQLLQKMVATTEVFNA